MKNKIFKALTALLLILSLACAIVSCGEEEIFSEENYYGLHYSLPDTYRRLTVPIAEFYYYDGHAYFYFHAYSPEALEAPAEDGGWEVAGDISVRSFTTKLMVAYNIPLYKDTYYEELDRSVIIHDWEYDETEDGEHLEDERNYIVIFRGSQMLYVVVMTCPVSMVDVYAPTFEEWSMSIYAD